MPKLIKILLNQSKHGLSICTKLCGRSLYWCMYVMLFLVHARNKFFSDACHPDETVIQLSPLIFSSEPDLFTLSRKRLLLFIVVATITISVLSFVSRCSHLSCRSRRFDCLLLVFFRRCGRLVTQYHYHISLVGCDWCISILTVLARSCSLSGPLLYRFPVVFLNRGHPRFGRLSAKISTIS